MFQDTSCVGTLALAASMSSEAGPSSATTIRVSARVCASASDVCRAPAPVKAATAKPIFKVRFRQSSMFNIAVSQLDRAERDFRHKIVTCLRSKLDAKLDMRVNDRVGPIPPARVAALRRLILHH